MNKYYFIKDGVVYYKTDSMTNPIMFGKIVCPILSEVNDEYEVFEIKKFNTDTCKYEITNEFDEFEIKGEFVKVIDGKVKVPIKQGAEGTYEPTQLDRIEAMVVAKNEEIQKTAIDSYTLQLMEEGVL
ncbi:hypothetical protein [Anaerotignum sp. MB30-C6]|uniref:hypothetical protein n=1 Tax=Anaerotignum sp. MB30-C6 TaxID=3070814 RepID=UPI0027DE000B|nr:hypothetical protein [Anaerotignum sp. MB30-C6]WMI82104.1 hypothetical protein RBQ60_05045 [Anaerotignum sp. MB30-C6]